MCRIWDLRSGKDVKKIHAHTNDILSIDFNKYENFVATASTDNLIKIFVSNLFSFILLVYYSTGSTSQRRPAIDDPHGPPAGSQENQILAISRQYIGKRQLVSANCDSLKFELFIFDLATCPSKYGTATCKGQSTNSNTIRNS